MCSLFSLLFLIGRFESLISTCFLGDFFIGTFDVRVTRTILRQPTTPRGPYQWANPLELRQFSEKSPLIILKSLLLYHRISPLHIHYSYIYISYIWRCPIHWGTPSFHPFLVVFSTLKHPATSIRHLSRCWAPRAETPERPASRFDMLQTKRHSVHGPVQEHRPLLTKIFEMCLKYVEITRQSCQ